MSQHEIFGGAWDPGHHVQPTKKPKRPKPAKLEFPDLYPAEAVIAAAMRVLGLEGARRNAAWERWSARSGRKIPDGARHRISQPMSVAGQIRSLFDGPEGCPHRTPCRNRDGCLELAREEAQVLARKALAEIRR